MHASVFISAANADYSAARAVYQFLTERDVSCFFCDESLLRVGEARYRATVDRALAAAKHVVVVAGSGSRTESEWVKYAWQGFMSGTVTGRRRGNVATVLCDGVEQRDLPAALRRGLCVSFPAQLDALIGWLKGGSFLPDNPQAPARTERRTRSFLVAVTACNVLILGLVIWLLQRNGLPAFSGSPPPPPMGPKNDALRNPPVGRGSVQDDAGASPGEEQGLAAAGESADSSDKTAAAAADVASPPDDELRLARSLILAGNLTDRPPAGTVISLYFGGSGRTGFCFIPRGTFVMGSPLTEAGRDTDESQRSVVISHDFWLARYECTQAVWQSVMGSNPSSHKGSGYPVETVSWDDVASGSDSFLAKVNSRKALPDGWRFALPTEAQWEYACRAGTTTPFSFGSVLDGHQANCDGSLPYGTTEPGVNIGRTTGVGHYPPNPWDLGDMHGNVWEWCADTSPAGSSGSTEVPVTTGSAVRRGGSWRFNARLCRSASGQWVDRSVGDDTLGFRLAIVRTE